MMEDKLMQLVKKWRGEADELWATQNSRDTTTQHYKIASARSKERCADELEQAIKEATK